MAMVSAHVFKTTCPAARKVPESHRLHRDVCLMCKEKRRPLFKFPQVHDRMKLWLQRLKKTDLLDDLTYDYIYNNGRLCNKHFDDKAFTSTLRTKLHNKYAEPTDLRTGTDAADYEDPVASTSGINEAPVASTSETKGQSATVYRGRDFIGNRKVSTPKSKLIKELRCKISKMKKKLFKASELIKIPDRPQLQDKLTTGQYEFVLSQIKNGKNTPANGRRWTVKEKAYALDIFLQSSSAYETLRKKLILPSKKTLRKCTAKVAKDEGFCPILFDALKRKVQELPEEERICTVVFDEMAIKEQLAFNGGLDKVDGYSSTGTGEMANQSLVFMLRGIMKNWKQVTAYYFKGRSTSPEWFKETVLHIVRKVMSCGLSVIAIVCDQGPPNQGLFGSLGITKDKPFFYVDKKKVFALYDMPHLIKSVRNNLRKYDCKFTNLKTNKVHTASWKDIEKFYEMDKKQRYRIAPKLTDSHFSSKSLGSMKVSRATQVFSHSVAAGLCVCYQLGMSPTALQTASFISKMDKIFDSMNSKFLKSPKKYACAVTRDSVHVSKWARWCKWISTWKFITKSKKKNKTVVVRTACKDGLILSLNAATGIWEAIQDKMKFLLTNRLNQDCLENTFASVRRRGGFRDNPNPLEFRSAIRNVIVHNFMKKSTSKNCEDDDAFNLIELGNNTVPSLMSFYEDDEENELVIDESREEVPIEFSDMEKNVIAYVSGVITKSVLKKTSCDECKNLLIGPKELQDHTFLLYFREYKDSHYDLKWPTDSYYNYIIQLSEAYFSNINLLFKKPNLQKNLYSILEKVNFDFFDHNHKEKVKNCILLSFLKMMIRHSVKIRNGGNFKNNDSKRLKHVQHK